MNVSTAMHLDSMAKIDNPVIPSTEKNLVPYHNETSVLNIHIMKPRKMTRARPQIDIISCNP